MDHYKSSAELKRLSKGQLLGKYNTIIAPNLLFGCGIFAVLLLYSSLTLTLDPVTGKIFDIIMQVIISLFTGVFSVGMAALLLNIIKEKPYSSLDIFTGFRQHADKAIIIRFFLTMLNFVLLAPSYLLNWFFVKSPSGALYLAYCIALIFAGLAGIWLDMMFCLWTCLVIEFPELQAREVIRLSREYMRGHKARRFYLSLSFVPLALLSMLGCFLPLLWLTPYINMTNANFYIDLMKHRNPVGSHIDEVIE